MKIIEKIGEFTATEVYNAINNAQSIKNEIDGTVFTVEKILVYEDTDANGVIQTITVFVTDTGDILATNSGVIRSSLEEMIVILSDYDENIIGKQLKKISGTSKAGRSFNDIVFA